MINDAVYDIVDGRWRRVIFVMQWNGVVQSLLSTAMTKGEVQHIVYFFDVWNKIVVSASYRIKQHTRVIVASRSQFLFPSHIKSQ